MNSKCFLLLAFAFLGAYGTPLVSTSPVSINSISAGVGPSVSETVVTPYHRTDAVSTPCGHSVVRTAALPIALPYGISTGTGFLGTASGVYPGVFAGGLTGATVGALPGVVAGDLAGAGSVIYPGIVTEGLPGTVAGVYPGVGGVAGAGIVAGGFGVCPATNVVV